MPYTRDIEAVAAELLRLDDIKRAIDDPNNSLSDAYVKRQILDRADTIWSEADSAIKSYEALEEQIGTLQKEKERLGDEGPWPVSLGIGVLGLAWTAVFFGLIVPWIFGAQYPGSLVSWLLALWTSGDIFQKIVLAGIPVGLIAFFVAASLRWYRVTLPELEAKFITDHELDTADSRLAAAKTAADQAVQAAGVRTATEVINEAISSFFQEALWVPSAEPAPPGVRETTGRGLSEVLNPANEVATEARMGIAGLLGSLPGASIGVAGPRGVGKSTLLWSLCHSPIQGLEQERTVAIYTAAPVEYDAREFLLHLFATLCRQVLTGKSVPEDARVPLEDDTNEKDVAGALMRGHTRLGWVALGAGFLMILFGLILASIMADGVQVAAPAASGAPATPVPLAGSGGFIKALDLKPGPVFQWGLIAALVGSVLVFADVLQRHRAALRRIGGTFIPRLRTAPRALPTKEEQLIVECRRTLHDIHFQRSYSSGWSGSLKIPAGFETSANRLTQLAQKQQSLPELVQQFRDFVELVSENYARGTPATRVIIAIDELDKLSSADKAQQFLNEIKAIFNVPNCFYLISVSENAISNFERRGLPIRDAFDSSFDDIRYVDYLSLDGSRKLLFRRVLNLPGPFLCLCHTLSAGLPRDLIRVTRAMLEFARKNPDDNSLRQVAAALIREEIVSKLRATAIAAREIALEPEVTHFLTGMTRLESLDPLSPMALDDARVDVPDARPDLSDDEKQMARKLAELQRELDAFLYFAVTTAQFFAPMTTDGAWRKALDDGRVDRLAKARQGLEVGSGIAMFRLTALRDSCNMPARAAPLGPVSNSSRGRARGAERRR